MGTDIDLHYTSVQAVYEMLMKIGQSAVIYKGDNFLYNTIQISRLSFEGSIVLRYKTSSWAEKRCNGMQQDY